MLNHMYEITSDSTDSRPRQRLKDPDEKVKFEHLGSANGTTTVRETQPGSCKSTGAVLLAWADIEPWRQYNRFIIRSYRPASNSYLKSISSLGYLHDQTVNIYSHLLGAIGFVAAGCVLYCIFSPRYHSATWADVAVFGAFAMGLFMCLTLSAAFHTFNNHSRSVYDFFFMFDMLGISFLIMGSFYPSIYYSFYCEPGPRYLYWAMITVFGSGVIIASITPKFRHRSWRHLRTALFLAMGLTGIVPMTHAALTFGIDQANRQMGWYWYIREAMWYVGGAVIYMAKVPERFAPGKFDVWGSSHQIFHVCVLLGAASHLAGTIKGFDYNHDPITRRC
ncbi:hypothetical protein VE02_04325 [Pseudogymnoascus sp. 03VT05]|nr:hypothetical protein VE02_04325 [Pseudogymnoascus sp. 03VT05]